MNIDWVGVVLIAIWALISVPQVGNRRGRRKTDKRITAMREQNHKEGHHV